MSETGSLVTAFSSGEVHERTGKSFCREPIFRPRDTRPPAVTDFEMRSERWSMEQRSAAYHRAAAARARRLRAEATTPWLKEHLENAIAQHEQIAAEIERASEPDRGCGVVTRRNLRAFKRNPRPIIRVPPTTKCLTDRRSTIEIPERPEASSHLTLRWREMDSVLRRSQTTPKTQRFRHSRWGDKKGFAPGFVPELLAHRHRIGTYQQPDSSKPIP